MWPVNSPSVSASETARACARGTRDKALRQRLLAAKESLETNSDFLKGAVARRELHLIKTGDFPVPGVSADEMKWMYTRQVAKSGRPARKVYDALVSAAPGGLCCYCQYGQAKTLDHFVPKDFIGSLAIDPWNLVPACEQCNHKLSTRWISSAEEQFLHPYDMPNLGRWLRATVTGRSPMQLSFHVEPYKEHGAELISRMISEFDALGLADMYSVVSAGDVEITSRTLRRVFETGSSRDVRAHLRETAADAFGHDENSRRGAVLEALADDDWFCAGGYALP